MHTAKGEDECRLHLFIEGKMKTNRQINCALFNAICKFQLASLSQIETVNTGDFKRARDTVGPAEGVTTWWSCVKGFQFSTDKYKKRDTSPMS